MLTDKNSSSSSRLGWLHVFLPPRRRMFRLGAYIFAEAIVLVLLIFLGVYVYYFYVNPSLTCAPPLSL